jgi:hypothetical protein
MHGGRSPGAPKGNRHAFKHGVYGAAAITRRREIAALLRRMRVLAAAVGHLDRGLGDSARTRRDAEGMAASRGGRAENSAEQPHAKERDRDRPPENRDPRGADRGGEADPAKSGWRRCAVELSQLGNIVVEKHHPGSPSSPVAISGIE